MTRLFISLRFQPYILAHLRTVPALTSIFSRMILGETYSDLLPHISTKLRLFVGNAIGCIKWATD